MTVPESFDRVRAIDVSCLCDARKTIRVMDAAIRPLVPGLKLVGRARPVSCRDDFLSVLVALREAAPGDVLMVDGRGGRTALAGELFATEAARKGLAGLIVDGAVRDIATLRTLGLPIYTRLITPMAGAVFNPPASDSAILCGGVTVAPGDIVIGDDDGVVVCTEPELVELLPTAESIHRQEAELLRRMEAGRSLFTCLNLDEHLDAIRNGRQSQLRFLL